MQQLNFLVDIKQKQSNILEARFARRQEKEPLKLTKEAKRQADETVGARQDDHGPHHRHCHFRR